MTLKDKLKAYTRTPGSLIVMLLVMLSAILTFAVLIFLIVYVVVHGVPYLKPSIFSLHYTSENASLMPALINTVIMTFLSLLIAVPFGIFSAIFLVEYAKRGNKFVEVIRLTTETLQGIPSIVYGLFGMLFFVTTCGWGFSILAGAFTLAIMVLQSVIFCGQFIHAILFCSLLLRLLSFDFSLRIFLAQAGQYLDAPEPGTYSTPHTVQFLAGIAAHRFVGMICNSSTKPMNL